MALVHRNFDPSTLEGGGSWPPFTPTKYVTTSGTEAWATNSEANPSSISTMLANAVAGDDIQVDAGIYTGTNTNDRDNAAYQFTNSGTSGNPIRVFTKYRAGDTYEPGVTTELRNGASVMGSGCPVFGSSGQDYVEWYGFYVDETNSPAHADTGPVVMFGTSGNPVTGAVIAACRIKGVTATWSDNHNGIRFEQTVGCKALDNKITGFRCDTTNDWNEAAILLYASTDYEIAYNELTDNRTGIYLKGAADSVYLRCPASVHHNKIHNNDSGGLRIGGVNANTGFTDIYQNLFYGHDGVSAQDISWQTWADPAPLNCRVVNNTFASTGDSNSYFKDDSPAATVYNGCVFQNNIINDRLTGDEALSTQFDQFGTVDYNSYTNATMFNSDSFTAFQTEGLDANGRQGSPGFTNAGADDYTLAGGSGCLSAGQDILNLLGGGTSASINQGCYILADQSDEIGTRSTPTYA